MNSLILVLASIGATTNSYHVDKSMWDIVGSISIGDLDPSSDFIGEVLPEVQKTLPNSRVYVYAIPTGKSRYYKIEVQVLEGVGHRRVKGVLYRVEFWPDGDRTIVRSFIDLNVVGRCRIIQRLVSAAESAILRRSESVMRRIADGVE